MLDHLHYLGAAFVAALTAFLFVLRQRPKTPVSPTSVAPSGPAPPPIPKPSPLVPVAPADGLTGRAAAELVYHEAIVLEAYKDSRQIWTWGIGITDASGHNVERYIDNPQPLSKCLVVFVWAIRTHYLPDVKKAFGGQVLSETQLAAALSFHYNTGAILHASWVDHWKAGDIEGAETAFMQWDKPASITERRQEECDLFFKGKWAGDGEATIFPVLKPSYQPNFHAGQRVNVIQPLEMFLG